MLSRVFVVFSVVAILLASGCLEAVVKQSSPEPLRPTTEVAASATPTVIAPTILMPSSPASPPAIVEPSPPAIVEPPPSNESKLEVEWTQLPGPPGGGYWTIAISPSNPQIVFVASRDFNVLKSTDGGNTWRILGEKLFGAHIFSNVVIHPKNSDKVFVGTGRIFLSEDGGVVWRKSSPSEGFKGIAIDESNPSVLYAGHEDGKLYKTTDGGFNWSEIADLGEARQLIVDKSNSKTIFARVYGKGVFKSTDSGLNWLKKSPGLSALVESRFLEADPSDVNILYFASDEGLFKTVNGGESWVKQGFGSGSPITISVASDSKTVYATSDSKQVYKSIDAGASWNKVFEVEDIQSHQGYNFVVKVDPTNPEVVYVASDRAVHKSIDGGTNWKRIDSVSDDSVFVLGYAKDKKTLWVGNYWTRGVFTTQDDGITWSFLESWRAAEPQDHYPMGIQPDPRDGNRVFVSGAAGLKVTSDAGKTWRTLGEGHYFHGKHVHGLAVVSTNPDVVYAGTAPGWDQVNPVAKIFKSVDGGSSWSELTQGFPQNTENNVYAFGVSKSNSSIVYAAVNGHEGEKEPHPAPLGVFKSTDGGRTWAQANGNLPSLNVFSIEVHPENPEVVYVGVGHERQFEHNVNEGLYRSTDGGKSWLAVEGLPQLQPSKIRFHSSNSSIVFTSFGEHVCGACAGGIDEDKNHYPRGGGAYASLDDGKTWTQLAKDFSERQMAVLDFVFADDTTIYAGTDDGIFKGVLEFVA